MRWEKLCKPKDKGGMGFKDLKSFNLALLAKQGWRLQNHPSLLFSRVFKAKYFPTSDFVNATMGKHPSYAWRSIMARQKIVEKGIVWRVGNGENIQIWWDRWIPNPSTYKISSPLQLLSREAKVKDLIKEGAGEWDLDLIKQVFLPHEVETILSIPLSLSLPPDKRKWGGTSNGKFTVSSTYRLVMEDSEKGVLGENSNQAMMKLLWKRIWGMRMPNKV